RNEYISVILDRSPENIAKFFEANQARELSGDEKIQALKLLELQRHAMLMYTSCGWFFDEISGIETVQVIEYAGRVLQLASELFSDAELEPGFLERLALAKSNVPEHKDGAEIYRKWVKPAIIGLKQIAAHYAIRSLVRNTRDERRVYCYEIDPKEVRPLSSGRVGVSAGRVDVRSRITQECADLEFGVIHFGDHNLSAGVRNFDDPQKLEGLVRDLTQSFNHADLTNAIRVLDQHFQGSTYSLKSLVGDDQKQIISAILENTMAEAEASFRGVYEHHAALLRFLTENNLPVPAPLRATAEYVVTASLRKAFESDFVELDTIRSFVHQARQLHLNLDNTTLGYDLANAITRLMQTLSEQPENTGLIAKLVGILKLVRELNFPVDLWRTQNIYYDMLRNVEPHFANFDQERGWVSCFRELGESLMLRVDQLAQARMMPVAA
ncbi:MAG: DUF3536 domain-containing protein, partial [Acidobacteriales bacterium]|nr:DUF3536 domain-containing protein [Terriglobales bacterium]